MTESIIRIEGITKDYGSDRGIFDISLDIKEGECFGFVGTNGSGKTTTIRNIMGFIKPDAGKVYVRGMDSWEHSADIKNYVSYVPGEIAFPPLSTGMDFLKTQAKYLGIKDLSYMKELLEMFRLDPTANLARMSKGMKQKTALVAALMGDREILILDEPTTGLDPLMREVFVDLINREKKRGRTIFISDHIFEEVEELCDKAAFIKDGHIIDIFDMDALMEKHNSVFHVGYEDGTEEVFDVQHGDTGKIFHKLIGKNVKYINEEVYTLEDYFNKAYQRR